LALVALSARKLMDTNAVIVAFIPVKRNTQLLI